MENIFPKRNFTSNSNGFTAHNSVYDDVFAGIPTLAPRLEDYEEIFGGFHFSRPSSIPIINLPAIGDESRRFVFDYDDVFGELGDFDCAASYEDLLGQSSGGYGFSDEAWSPSQSEAFSDEDINISKDFSQNVTERKRYKKFTLNPSYSGFKYDFNPSEKPGNSVSSLDIPFITIADISLRTKPSQLPPPSRPPPALTVKNNECDGSNSAPFFDVDVDASSCDVGKKYGNKMKGSCTKESIKKKEDSKLHAEDVVKMEKTFSKSSSFESEEMKESDRIQDVGSVPCSEKTIKAEMRFSENSKLAGSWKEEKEYFEVVETNFQNNGKRKENIEIEEECRRSVELDIEQDETREEVKERIGHEESEKPQKEATAILEQKKEITVENGVSEKKLLYTSVEHEKINRNKSEKDNERITEMIYGRVLEDDQEQKESEIMKEKSDDASEREENITGLKREETNGHVKEVNEGLIEGEQRKLSDEENEKPKKIYNPPKRVYTEDEIRGRKVPNINKNKEDTLPYNKSDKNPRVEKGILAPKNQKLRENLTSETDLENEDTRKIEEEERQREREKDRMTVDKTALEDRTRLFYNQRAANALAEKSRHDLLAQREREETNRVVETLDAQVKRWSSGKEGNLRALLSTLQYILGSDSGWKPVSLTELITCACVKKSYRRATLCVHPDKVQQRGATMQQKYICDKVFELLKEGWNKFNSEER